MEDEGQIKYLQYELSNARADAKAVREARDACVQREHALQAQVSRLVDEIKLLKMDNVALAAVNLDQNDQIVLQIMASLIASGSVVKAINPDLKNKSEVIDKVYSVAEAVLFKVKSEKLKAAGVEKPTRKEVEG